MKSKKNPPSPKMAFFRSGRLWLGTLGLLAIMLWAGGGLRDRIPAGRLEIPSGRPVPADAEVFAVTNAPIHPSVRVVGTIESARTIHLSARLAAYIEEIRAVSGQPVGKDETLVVLDDRDLREQLAVAEAHLGRAAAEFERTRKLAATGAATPRDYDLAEASLKAAEAEVERVRVMLSDTRIHAPFDGIIARKNVEAGDLASPGQVLMSIYDPSDMRLEMHVPVRLLGHFPVGSRHRVDVEYPQTRQTGMVCEQVGAIDPATRTRTVKLQLETGGPALLPGSFAGVVVREAPHQGAWIPRSAILRVGQLEMVDLVEDGVLRRRMITTGVGDPDGIEVLSGLRAGDRILRNPARGFES